MIKQLFLLLWPLLSFSSFLGQENSVNVISKDDTSLYYKKNQHISSIQISSTKKDYLINNIIGVHVSGYGCGSAFSYCRYISLIFNQVLPPIKKINDTLNTNLIGYYISYLDGVNIIKNSSNIDLVISLGFEFGRLRLYGNPLLRKKNSFFAPKIEIQPKIKIKRFVIGGFLGYGYDISNPNWKNTWFSKDKSYSLDKLSQSGYSWQVFLGWSM